MSSKSEKAYLKRKISHKELLGQHVSLVISDLVQRAVNHDNDKLCNMSSFSKHYSEQRHHWLSTRVNDINACDILEMVCDVKAASLAKHPSFVYVVISDDMIDDTTLRMIISNTFDYFFPKTKIKFISTSDFNKINK